MRGSFRHIQSPSDLDDLDHPGDKKEGGFRISPGEFGFLNTLYWRNKNIATGIDGCVTPLRKRY